MESTNPHHHHHHHIQDNQLVDTSSHGYGVSTTSNAILCPSNFGSVTLNPRDLMQPNEFLASHANTSVISQDLGIQWANSNNTIGTFTTDYDFHHARIKGEFSDSYRKFSERLLTSQSNINELQSNPLTKNEQGHNFDDLSSKLLLRNFDRIQIPATGDFYSCSRNEITSGRGNFSQIFPTINVSNFNRSSNSFGSSSLDVNMQPLNLLNSGRFADNNSFYKESFSNYGLMKQTSHTPSNSLNKVPPLNTGITEAKRPNASLEPKAPQKRSRSESRSSCPPFKVRKEKLGDRIAALQQLVAPFGKTDTASVLMEAIGYIKFLQNQVETLSVPYMKSSRNKSNRTMMRGSSLGNGNEELKRDLRSRGLCLMPLSCLSYLTDGDGGVWPAPSF